MVTLKDYIGTIYKEITKARVQSDIETIEIAKAYDDHDLLKHFTIPNIKMKKVDIAMPVALDRTYTRLRDFDLDLFVDTVKLVAIKLYKKEKLSPSEDDIKRLEEGYANELTQFIKKIEQKQAVQSDIFFEELLDELDGVIKKVKALIENQDEWEVFVRRFHAYIEVEFVSNKEINIPIIAESSRIKDANPESIVKINIQLEEDNMEWVRGAEGTDEKDYLIYE